MVGDRRGPSCRFTPALLPSPDVLTHDDLIAILEQYTSGVHSDWPEEDLEKGQEDFFQREGIVPKKDNAFSASAESSDAVSTEYLPLKKMKLSDGSTLDDAQSASRERGEY